MSSALPTHAPAIRVHAYGGNDQLVLEDIEVPRPGEGEVLVRIDGAGVNPVDWKIVRGRLAGFIPAELPFVPGWELGGVIVARGHAARRFDDGDRVFAYARRPLIHRGTYARYQVVPEAYLAAAPTRISTVDAGGVPLTGLTAYQSLHGAAALAAGETLLVIGASGGVGAFAVQLGKIAGARVIAVASARSRAFLHEIGADEVIAYDEGDPAAPLPIPPGTVDLLFDCAGGPTVPRAALALRAGGRAVSITQSKAPPAFAAAPWHYVFVEPHSRQLAALAAHIDAGRLVVHVSARLPLAAAAEAHAASEAGHTRGKVVLVPEG